jgi:hypothetical protein
MGWNRNIFLIRKPDSNRFSFPRYKTGLEKRLKIKFPHPKKSGQNIQLPIDLSDGCQDLCKSASFKKKWKNF